MVFSRQELEFIAQWELKLPGIMDNFNWAVGMAPELRPAAAKERLEEVYRDGWNSGAEFGWHPAIPLENLETTGSHVKDITGLARKHFSGTEGQEIEALLEVHDDGECIAHYQYVTQGVLLRRDINLYREKHVGADAIGVVSRAVKTEIESLAIDVLFEAAPERKALWLDFEHKRTVAAEMANSLDIVAVMVKCGEYLDLGMQSADFQRYWDAWTLDRVKETCHSRVYELYRDELWPQIQENIWAADSRDLVIS